MTMLPSFIRQRYNPDDTDGRHTYTRIRDDDWSTESKPSVDEVEDDSILEADESLLPINTRRQETWRRLLRHLFCLVPSFLRSTETKTKPLRSTAWLGNKYHAQYL